ncbi:hypothetical protein COLSTE_00612 [Collinsella stercoris DSM 13279]|uniref:Uncharacterized protein n=1 Tax=Collinsella stercoris DSM 13279 TaxID=445975 RepID=B6G971_9ACTN|nr:hypothetical protein COLSTE_00612 [Collinsella stercoris DSM 13279]
MSGRRLFSNLNLGVSAQMKYSVSIERPSSARSMSHISRRPHLAPASAVAHIGRQRFLELRQCDHFRHSLILKHLELIGRLQVKPKLRGRTQCGAKQPRHLRGNRAPPVHDVGNGGLRLAYRFRQAILANPHWLKKFLAKYLARG